MAYEDSNRELRIRQRSIQRLLAALYAGQGVALFIIAGVVGGSIPPAIGGALGLVMALTGVYAAKKTKTGTLSRWVHKRINDADDIAPTNEYDVLKERTSGDERVVADGGDTADE